MNSFNELNKDKIESKDIFKNLKNDYFLRNVFNNLLKKKLLDIIKYNKNIQKGINIIINDYKNFSEKYSSIEIEIRPFNKKYGKFIYIKKEEEIYYHIYFNNNEEEIKRNYIYEDEDIKIIRIKIDYQVKSFENLFSDCKCIESLYFKKFYRNNINNMNSMFSLCSSLKELRKS